MNKKHSKKYNMIIDFIGQSIFVMFCVISIILFGIVISLGILPTKYLIFGILIIFLLYFGMGFGLFKKNGRIIKIVLSVICIAFIMIYLLLLQYLNSTLNFMDRIKAGKYETENYYVIVNKDSNYNDLKQITTLGVYNARLSDYDKALSILDESIDFEQNNYTSYTTLIDGLTNGEVMAIMMNAASKEILSELDKSFNESTKIIYTIEVKTENNVDTSNINVAEEPFIVYISGIDVYGDINSVSRSDVNMIVTINPKTHQVLLTSIPRDYYVQLHGTDGVKDKLTHAGLYGINMSIETIEDLLDIKIDYYIRVNFSTVVSLVDAVGGIELYSDTAFTAWTDRTCTFPVGTVKVRGNCALAYARERYSYIDGDRHRVRNQQDVIKAIIKKTLSSEILMRKYSDILKSMEKSFQTNIPPKNIYELINKQLSDTSNWNVETYSLNGYDSSNVTYTFGEQVLYVMEPNKSTINIAKEKINALLK